MNGCSQRQADTVIVLDFETTGLSPDHGDRAIEIGAVRIEHGRITDRFQQLMNPGRRISSFIEGYTGITNAMLRDAPPCREVMTEFREFIGDFDLVAHNASFDRRFLEAELRKIRRRHAGEFACSMLVSRRIYPDAPSHKLGTLVEYKCLPTSGTFHRALADAEMTTHLWLQMLDDISDRHCLETIPFALMQELSRVPRASAKGYLEQWRQ
ncbi:MAG: 3'-5' exonuclease [Gammaproteobacteria bacterium]|nr:MAG: 3'-5' exonuclease [Gammaproteobacteria bacterium]